MKRFVSRWIGILLLSTLGLAGAFGQDQTAVTFKVFPPDYEVFSGGDRLAYVTVADGLRSYRLRTGSTRINLTAPGAAPVSLTLEVKAGMPVFQAKLEPRTGPLALVAEAATGRLPRSLAFSADGKRLFVALQGEAFVEAFEVPSLKSLGRYTPAEGATGGFTDVLAVGSEVWAVQNDGRIHGFDGSTLAAKATWSMTGGGNAFLTDLGSGRVAVANWDNLVVQRVEVETRKSLGSLGLPGSVRGFSFAQGFGYATLFDRGQVAVVDGTTWKVKSLWPAGQAPRPVAALGTTVLVGDMAGAQVLVLDGASGKVLTRVPVASNPHQMAADPTRSLVAVASRGRNNLADYQKPGPEYGKVTLLDGKGVVLGSVWGRNQPTGLAFSADGRYLAFTDFLDNNVELYRVTPANGK